MHRHCLAIGALALLTGCAHVPRPRCAESPGDAAAIERTVHAMYDALRADDSEAFRRVTTAAFYSFDGGERFDGTALVDAIRKAHAAGTQITWSVGPMHTKFQCDVAWSAWENVGSVGKPGEAKPVRWLESAVFVRAAGRWKIDFFHSHRATAR